MEKFSKILVGFAIGVVITLVVFFVGCWIEAANRPEHKVKVEYVIYRGNKAYEKSEVYSVKGENFKPRIYTRTQRYGNGPNVDDVQDVECIIWNQEPAKRKRIGKHVGKVILLKRKGNGI